MLKNEDSVRMWSGKSSFVSLMSDVCVYSSVLRVSEILSGYSEGQIFSLMEERSAWGFEGKREREGRRHPANQGGGRRKWKMDDDRQRKAGERRQKKAYLHSLQVFESISWQITFSWYQGRHDTAACLRFPWQPSEPRQKSVWKTVRHGGLDQRRKDIQETLRLVWIVWLLCAPRMGNSSLP